MSASGKTLPKHDAKIARTSFGAVWSNYISIFVEAPDYRWELSTFPVVLGQGISLFSRNVLADVPIKAREKVDLKANQRIQIAL